MLDYRIRPAIVDDVMFLADLIIDATRAQGRLPVDFDEQQWRQWFGEWTLEEIEGPGSSSTTSVIEVDRERVGRLRIDRTADHLELCGIQLLPRIQRRGIGTAIIEDLQAQAVSAGVPVDLGVEKDNPQARKLYERLGFVQVGETRAEHRLRWNPGGTA